ncbi:MAG: cysteine--tRNA ligase [Candidatus Hydrothermarchaeota archaeon]
MSLTIYNTLTKKKEEFVPLEEGRVKMYTCGLTVNDYMHIGHARCYIFWDVLQRYLEYLEYEVYHVSNITDISIDEKILKRIKELGISFQEIIEYYTNAYFEDRYALGISRANVHPLATQHIQEMIELIQKLIEKGYAYIAEDGVYYDISKFQDYGKLSGVRPKELKEGASGRIDSDEYSKKEVGDFSLWKAAKKDEPYWYSPWFAGRPGWHIECSAMSMKYLGESFDIHGGGEDNIFPHHENEIAQSEGATGKRFVNYWMHVKHVLMNGEKMSKSLGNYITAREAISKYGASLIRFFLLSTHYRSQIDFNEKDLEASRKRLERLKSTINMVRKFAERVEEKASREDSLIKGLEKTRKEFEEAMNNDFNISLAIKSLIDLTKEINIFLKENKKISGETSKKIFDFFQASGKILFGDLFEREIVETQDRLTEDLIDLIIEIRKKARMEKDFETADKIRSRLKEIGIVLEDYKEETIWKIKHD